MAAEGVMGTDAPVRNDRGNSRSARPSGTLPLNSICRHFEQIKCLRQSCFSFCWKLNKSASKTS